MSENGIDVNGLDNSTKVENGNRHCLSVDQSGTIAAVAGSTDISGPSAGRLNIDPVDSDDSRSEEEFFVLPNKHIIIREMDDLASQSEARLETNTLPEDIENTGGQNGESPKNPLRRQASYYTPYLEDRLRRKLKFHFMGPHEKIKAKRRCPWKLFLQIFKVFLVTAQLIVFGYERSSFVEYVEKNNIALKHLYLKKWDPSFETMPYPPATGTYAVYNMPELIDHINFAMRQFNHTEDIAIGSLRFWRHNGTVDPMNLCISQYREAKIFDNNTFVFNPSVSRTCLPLGPVAVYNSTTNTTKYKFDVMSLLEDHSVSLNHDKIVKVELVFKLLSYRLDVEKKSMAPECFKVDGKAVFDDSNKDGQMLVELISSLQEMDCNGEYGYESDEKRERIINTVFDIFVLCVSVLSSLLCLRSLFRAYKLQKETSKFFTNRFRKSLSCSDKMAFLNLWYVVIVINDILTVIGSSFKIQLEHRDYYPDSGFLPGEYDLNARSSSQNYDLCGLMLGTGSLLVWMGVIRYIGFFRTFNILTVVLKKAFPDMMRFLVTTLMLYFGFMFCGWVVLGPYHIKFRHLSTSSECLFSLINGDDMFVTFSATQTENDLVWYYSRIYLYLFISLFIYAVLNLFIAVILDTYETIKEYYEQGFPKTELFEFIEQCNDPPSSSIYRGEDRGCTCGLLSYLLCCCKKNHDVGPSEYTSLLH